MRARAALATCCCIFISLFSSISTYAENLVLSPFMGNEGETPYDANILAISEEAGYVIFSSRSENIPGYQGLTNTSGEELVYVKNIETKEIALLSQTVDGEVTGFIEEDEFSEITQNNAVFFPYYGDTPLAGTVYEGNWADLNTELFRLDLVTSEITPISLPYANYYSSRWLATQNEYLYTYDRTEDNLYYSTDVGESWLIVEISCHNNFYFHDFSQSGEILYTCQDVNSRAVQIFNPESRTTESISVILPLDYAFDDYRDDNVELTADGSNIVYIQDNIVKTFQRQTEEIQTFSIKSFDYRDVRIRAMDSSGTFVLVQANYKGNILSFENEEQRFFTSGNGLFYLELKPETQPKRINIVKENDSVSSFSVNEVFIEKDDSTIYFQSEFSFDSMRRTFQTTPADIADHQFSSSLSDFSFTVTNEDAHKNYLSLNFEASSDILFRVYRESDKYGKRDSFWLEGSEFSDYQLGLRPGDNTYSVVPCDYNLVCAAVPLSQETITTQDFPPNENWTLTVSERDENQSQFLVRVANIKWPESSSTLIHNINLANKQFTSDDSHTFILGAQESDVVFAILPCMTNRLKDYDNRICSETSSTKTVSIPKQADATLLMSRDYSAVYVYFDQQPGLEYSIYKKQYDGDFVEVMANANSGWVDEEVTIGESYQYYVLSCEPNNTLCIRSNTERLTVARQETVTASTTETDSGDLVFNVQNHLQVDSIRISRAGYSEGYEVIGSIAPEQTKFTDYGPVRGINYDYKIESILNNEVQEALHLSVKLTTPEIADVIQGETISGVNIDAQYVFGHLLSWDKLELATHYEIKTFLDGEYSRSETIFAEETPVYFYEYTKLGFSPNRLREVNEIQHRVTPIFNRCKANQYKCEEVKGATYVADFSMAETSLFDFTNKQLMPVSISIEQNSLSTIEAEISASYPADSYWLERKTNQEETWQVVSFKDSYSDGYAVTLEDNSSSLEGGKTYQYRAKTCSYLIALCTTSSEQNITFKGVPFVGTPYTPSIISTANGFEINFNFVGDSYVSTAEIQATWGDGNHSRIATSNLNSIIYMHKYNSMEAGELITFSARYCIARNDCTPYSDEVVIQVSDSDPVSTPHVSKPESTPDIEGGTINVAGLISASNNWIGTPDTLEIYRSTNNEGFRYLATLTLEYNQYLSTPFEYDDNTVVSGVIYQYAIKACNSGGCDMRQGDVIEFFIKDDIPLPDKPEIIRISQREYINQINIEFVRIKNNLVYELYRATSPDEEYELIDRIYAGTTYSDDNLVTDSTYYYRVDACNAVGCSSSDILEGSTASEFNSTFIEIDGTDLNNLSSSNNAVISSQGSTQSVNGVLDAFSGSIKINQWLALKEGWMVSTSAYSEFASTSCTELLKFNLQLPNLEVYSRTRYPYSELIGAIYYTGNGCDDYPELSNDALYFVSDYIEAPVNIDSGSSNSWRNYAFEFNAEGSFAFLVDNEEVATSLRNIDLNVFGYSKFSIETTQFGGNRTHISNFSIQTQATPSLNASDTFYYYRPSFESFHPKNITVETSTEVTGSLQYLTINEGDFSEMNETSFYSGGNISAYITNLTPGQNYQFLARRCSEEACGPFEYLTLHTRTFSELRRAPHMFAYLNTSSSEVTVHVDTFNQIHNIDSYTIYRQIVGEEETRIFAQFTIEDLADHFLVSSSSYTLPDLLELNQTARYFLEVCNPIGCFYDEDFYEFTMPGDSDNDGVLDPLDAFPFDPNETTDTDGDGIGNNADEDDDGDGIPDSIELSEGLDPLNHNDADDDLDGDGFYNIFEYLADADLNDATSTPKNVGIYDSFESPKSKYLTIEGDFEHTEISTDGTQSIFSEFANEESESLTFSITGKLIDGNLIFTHYFYNSRVLALRINGVAIALSEKTHLLSDVILDLWSIIAIPLEATDELVTLELEFHAEEGGDFAEVFIDNLFIPMTDAKLVGVRSVADFDGDGKTDITVRKGALATNYVLNSSDSEIQRIQFGSKAEDIQVEGDFDGDGIADAAVRRPSTGTWYVQNSSGSNVGSEREDGIQRVEFGAQEDDIPVPADYDGDGITDFAVRRPSTSMWYIKNSSGSNYNSDNEDTIQRVKFGLQNTDIPVPADYDGDGIADIAVRRPSNSTWYILESSSGEIQRIKFGLQETDIPVPADFDGDGKADVAFRRPSNKTWYVLRSSDEVIERIQFGLNVEDIPVVGDYDGDGKADIAVRRESNSMWYILQSSYGEIDRVNFGKSDGMVPVLAPIWEKLSMLGWQQNFVEATLAGKGTDNIADDEEMIFFEKSEFYNHEELVEVERINCEQLH